MDSLAKKLIYDHRNPIVKVDVSGSKLFLKSSTQEEAEFIEKQQSNLENILNYERAERRCARSHATWSPDDELAKVTRTVKTLNHFGYQDKNGTYLYPEETLFLMETNRLEVTNNAVPLSIQEGYSLLLKSECDVLKYKVYKKLALLGYRLLRYSELLRRLSKITPKHDTSVNNSTCKGKHNECSRKRTSFAENDGFSPKKYKLDPENENSKVRDQISVPSGSKTSPIQLEFVKSIFEKLRDSAPREYESKDMNEATPQFCVFLPNNKSRSDYDFNLYICEDSILKTRRFNDPTPSVFVICSEGNISFYKFSNVKLPCL